MKNILLIISSVFLLTTGCSKSDEYIYIKAHSDIKIEAQGHQDDDKWSRIEIVLRDGNVYRLSRTHVYELKVTCEQCSYTADGIEFDTPESFRVSPNHFYPIR